MAITHGPASSRVQQATILLGLLIVIFIWALFLYQVTSSRQETLSARKVEHRNLALISSESMKQMTDRASALAGLIDKGIEPDRQQGGMVVNLLAEDPLFNRLALYSPGGEVQYASHPDSRDTLASAWLTQFREHQQRFGGVPMIPRRLSDGADGMERPVWRLPVLIPARTGDRIFLMELDVGYLVGLLQRVSLGDTTFIQILDETGLEWIRANSRGVITGGEGVERIQSTGYAGIQLGGMITGTDGQELQRQYVSRLDRGFTLVVNQSVDEILRPLQAGHVRQLILNVLMTLLVTAIILWLRRTLIGQQEAFQALQASETTKRQLIERLETEHARSSRAAAIDHLSGLLNRRQFMEVASGLLEDQRRNRRLSSLIFIDLDRFKAVNDSLGHKVGDLLLQAVAGRIQRSLEPEDLAARFGGDEFVVMLAGQRREEDIEHWVLSLSQHLSAPYELDGVEINNSPSIGIAICPRDGQTLEDLVQAADAAMYSAKKAGRGHYRFFDQSLNLKDVEGFLLEQSFAEALRNHDFILYYQPQVDLETQEVVSYEALVRWQHPEFGLLFPDRFIDLAESSGFILPLGLEVIRLACEQMRHWRHEGMPATPVAVNVSPHQLAQPDFPVKVMDMLAEYHLKPGQLELEITETAMLDSQAVEQLHVLRQAGIRLALDDFGTGYAGFAHLEAVPVDKLKIDRSLIASICNTHDDSPIVSSTIILAKRMSLKVVAEGVETREQLVHLKVAGCDVAQGYHLGRPMPAEHIPAFIERFEETESLV